MHLRSRLLWSCFGSLLLALLAFIVITERVGYGQNRRGPQRLAENELTQAVGIYQHDGLQALSRFLTFLDGWYGSQHHLMDNKGIDVISGDDRLRVIADLSHPSTFEAVRTVFNSQLLGKTTFVAGDGNYWLLAVEERVDRPRQLMYMITLLAAIAFVYSFVAAGITTPLRSLATAAEEFGHGNMAVRVTCRRRDEIGNLARSFNAMADRIKGLLIAERQLLQDVSHELRSPLARIAFAAELARTADNRDAAIDRLNNELRGLTKLVASLLDVTTIEGDPATIKTEETEIEGVVDACVKSCALQAEAQGCRIHVVGDSSRPVRCNRELLRRAFDNVIRNAIQYSPPDSDIEVSLADDDNWVVASVRDHGSGVPEELLSRIFEPFFRVDAARDAATGGVGLGLSIVRRIVLLHHGTVTAENSLPGLRVRIAIPSVACSEAKQESPQSLAKIA